MVTTPFVTLLLSALGGALIGAGIGLVLFACGLRLLDRLMP